MKQRKLGGAQNNAIEFDTYLGRDAQVRGTVTDNNFTSFKVLASYTGQTDFGTSSTPNFMHNQEVTRESASAAWGYTPVKYWPSTKGDKVSFFAYAPTAASSGITISGNTAPGAPTARVILLGADKMVDFVAGVRMNRMFDTSKGADDNKVSFELKHEMTRLGIQAKLDNEVYNTSEASSKKTFVVIKDVKIDKAAEGGQFYTQGTYTFSTTDGVRGEWSNLTGATSDFPLESVLAKTSQTANGAVSGDYKTGVQGIRLTNGNPVSLFNADHYLFLIPAGETGLGEGKATATISYDIVTEDSKLALGYSVTSATKTVNLPSSTLEQGKAYTYTFIIKLNEVILSATVDAWGTATDGNVTVDYSNKN